MKQGCKRKLNFFDTDEASNSPCKKQTKTKVNFSSSSNNLLSAFLEQDSGVSQSLFDANFGDFNNQVGDDNSSLPALNLFNSNSKTASEQIILPSKSRSNSNDNNNIQSLSIKPNPSFFKIHDDNKPKILKTKEDVEGLYKKKPSEEIIIGIHEGRPIIPKKYEIYTINSFNKLVENLKKAASKHEANKNDFDFTEVNEELHAIRYLLTVDGELLFAPEGAEPAHFAMTGLPKESSSARAAGNLIFNDDFTKIEIINNKSGHYRPEDVLLKPVLAMIIALHEEGLLWSLEDKITIEHQCENKTYEVELSVLKDYVKKEFTEEELENFVKVNRKAKHRTVDYSLKKVNEQEQSNNNFFSPIINGTPCKKVNKKLLSLFDSPIKKSTIQKHDNVSQDHSNSKKHIARCNITTLFEAAGNREEKNNWLTLNASDRQQRGVLDREASDNSERVSSILF